MEGFSLAPKRNRRNILVPVVSRPSRIYIALRTRRYSCSSGGCVALGSVFSPAGRFRELFLRSLEGLVALSAGDSSAMPGDAVSPRPLGDGVTPVLPPAPRVPLVDGLAVPLPYGDAVPRGLADAVA